MFYFPGQLGVGAVVGITIGATIPTVCVFGIPFLIIIVYFYHRDRYHVKVQGNTIVSMLQI